MELVLWLWAIFLALAVLVTIPALGIVVRFVLHAREVDRLARVTLDAAAGVAANTSQLTALDTLLAHATALARTCATIDGVAARVHDDAGALVRTMRGGGR